jgi:WD40 repeat protein
LPYQPVRTWDLATGELKRALDVGPLGADRIVLSPDGRRLAVLDGRIRRDARLTSRGIRYWANYDPLPVGTLRRFTLYDTASGARLGRTPGFPDAILPAAFTADGRRLLVGHRGGVAVFDATNAAPVTTLAAPEQGSAGLGDSAWADFELGRQGRRLVVRSGPSSLATYETATWDRVAAVPDLGEAIVGAWLVKDEQEILTLTGGGNLVWHDALSGRELGRAGGLKQPLSCFALSPDERYLAAVQSERQVVVVQAGTGEFLGRYDGHLVGVVAVAFSPDGRWLATGDEEGVIRLWPLVSPGGASNSAGVNP